MSKFLHDTKGSIAMLSAVALPLFLTAIVGVIEIYNFEKTKAKMQNSLDDAVLAAIQDGKEGYTATLKRFYAQAGEFGNVKKHNMTEKDDVRTLQAEALYDYPSNTLILQAFKNLTISVKASSKMDIGSNESLADFEDAFEDVAAGSSVPPMMIDGVEMTFKGFIVVEPHNRASGFWGWGGYNIANPRKKNMFNGKSITMGSNAAAAFNTGTAEIHFNPPVDEISFAIADLEGQFVRRNDNVTFYDPEGNIIAVELFGTGYTSTSGEVHPFEYDHKNVARMDITLQDPIGLDNLRFTPSKGSNGGFPILTE